MKFSPSSSLRKAEQITERIYDRAEVESAYDSRGHLKFLLARIPRSEFFRLYGQTTFATLFHRGLWIQFARHGKSIAVSERTSGMKFHLELRKNAFGWAQVLLQKKGKTEWKQTLTPEDLEHFEMNQDLLQTVAKACTKAIGEPTVYSDDERFVEEVASIHILPESEDEPEFSSALVHLH